MDPEPRSEGTSSALSALPASSALSVTGTAPAEPETVLVRVPADPDYLAVVRSAGAHVATKFGCTLSEVADLRLAVDEAGGLLLRDTVGDRQGPGAGDLECRFVLADSVLRVVLSRQAQDVADIAGIARPEDDDFGWTILSALVDDILWRVDGPTVRVELVKRRPAGR